MSTKLHKVESIESTNGNELDLGNKNLPAGFQMGGVDIATTANIITSFILGDAEAAVTVGGDKFVYLDESDGKVKEALASDVTSNEHVYFTIAGSLANGFPVSVVTEVYQPFGVTFETGQTPTLGAMLYLSDSEAGTVTHTEPTQSIPVGELVDTVGDKVALLGAVQTRHDDVDTNTHLVQVHKATIAHDSAGTVELIPASLLATDDEVWDVRFVVNTAFDQASTLELGVSGDTDAVAVIDLTATVGEIQKELSTYVMTASEAVNLTYTANAATAGNVTVYATRVSL